jgi:hypothetical protein
MFNNRDRSILPRASFGIAVFLGIAAPALAQPANDQCANAIPIPDNTPVSGTTVQAGLDGSANCGASESAADVWYRYTATATGTFSATTCITGTGYDTVVSVHSATCPGTIGTQIACNDDSCLSGAGGFLASTVSFQAVMKTEYLIRVSGFGGATGEFVLSIQEGTGIPPPPNDACAGAAPIGDGLFSGSTSDATADGSSTCAGSGSPDVYYLYTAPSTGPKVISTCFSTFYDSILSLHTGCPATTDNQIACNNDFCGPQSEVTFDAVANTEYVIRIGGNNTTGFFQLSVGDPAPPGTVGPDVTYADCTDIANYGSVGGIRAYAIGSATCNMGDQDLAWDNHGSPALAMNAYRLDSGRLVQIGLGFCKVACCAAAGPGCGGPACNGHGGPVLGSGCRDVYGAGFNGGQFGLSPRSTINAYTGTIADFSAGASDAISRRLQVLQDDLDAARYPNALYFVEGEYIARDDAPAGNALNNASYRRATVTQGSFDMSPAGTQAIGIPAIQAWRDHGLGVNTPDNSVTVFAVDVPQEGRFWVATKVTTIATDRYLYDYAIFNLNSDRSGGSFSVPRGAGAKFSSAGFHDVRYHSGEPYDNTDWSSSISATEIEWHSPQTFAQNPNSNALRWGTMYNYWFEANTPPASGLVTLGLFKPGTPTSVSFNAVIPGPSCTADWNEDGTVTSQDFFDFVEEFFTNNADFNGDGVTNSQDFFDFLTAFFTGC